MNIYVTTSLAADAGTKKMLREMSLSLKGKGHKVNDSRLGQDLKDDQYTDDDLARYYKDMINSIKQCDIMIVDISSRSSGLGYEIGVAIGEKKPILAVYFGNERRNSSLALTSTTTQKNKLLSIENYGNEKELIDKTEKFLGIAKDKIDTKFILIISPDIDKYLEWSASERRQHKAQIVRNAVEQMMQKDKDYKDFLKSIE